MSFITVEKILPDEIRRRVNGLGLLVDGMWQREIPYSLLFTVDMAETAGTWPTVSQKAVVE